MRTWIKICGTTCIEDALASMEAGADAVGFIFAPSKRRVSAQQAGEIIAQLPRQVERIGVFCNEPAERVAEAVERVGLTGVQFHGGEPPAFIDEFRSKLAQSRRIIVIKSILVNETFATRLDEVLNHGAGIDFLMMDSGGGTGRTFDWQTVQPLVQGEHARLIVAGGLHPGNVGEAIRKFSPRGVDVVSGVEREPGRKDPEKLRSFVAAVRKAEQP
jgi:phosphoribosylanthranilate isomerase